MIKSRIELEYENSLQHKLFKAITKAEKQNLINEISPMYYAFGKALKPYKPYLTYDENV